MDFKVNYDTLHNLSEDVLNQTQELSSLFDDLIDTINALDTAWVGPDSENFKTISINYINDLYKVTDELEYIGTYMGKASKVYSENDNKWQENMKKIGDDADVYR